MSDNTAPKAEGVCMLSAALELAKAGIPVFPCRQDKRPLVEGGFKSATTDNEQIAAWWARWPHAMIGLPTGATTGLVVLDVDSGPGKDGESSLFELVEQYGSLPDTLEALTPTGGRHLYFRHPGGRVRNSTGKLGRWLDVRGDGGYVIVPPSRREAGSYEWEGEAERLDLSKVANLPGWLLALLAEPEHRDAGTEDGGKVVPMRDADPYANRAFGSAISAILCADDGERNNTLNREAHGLYGLAKAGRLDKEEVTRFLEKAAAFAGLDAREIPATLKSAWEAARPRAEGQAVADVAQIGQAAARAAEAIKAGIDWQPPAPISQEEWLSAKLTPPVLVEHYLYADLALLVAAGGTGKTTLTMWEAVHVALGRPLYGRRTREGWVLFLTGEDSRERLTARLREVCESMSLPAYDLSLVRERVRISDLSGQPFKLAANVLGDVTLTANVDRLIKAMRDNPPALIVIDPYVSFGPGEASVNDGAQAMVLAARRLIRALGCCVRFIHHVGQDAARSAIKDQYTGRGGTALPDGSRMVAVLSPVKDQEIAPANLRPLLEDGGQLLELTLPKLSYCPPQAPILIARNGWEIAWAKKPSEDQAKGERAKADDAAALQFLSDALKQGQKHTIASAKEQYELSGIPRDRLRAAIGRLLADGRLQLRDLPENECWGRRKQYLHPANETVK